MPGRLEPSALLGGPHLAVPDDALRIMQRLAGRGLRLAAEGLDPQVRSFAIRVVDEGDEPAADLHDERVWRRTPTDRAGAGERNQNLVYAIGRHWIPPS